MNADQLTFGRLQVWLEDLEIARRENVFVRLSTKHSKEMCFEATISSSGSSQTACELGTTIHDALWRAMVVYEETGGREQEG